MIKLQGSGKVVFIDVKETETYYINIYLIKTDKANVKVVNFLSKELHTENIVYPKDAEIGFYGILRENRYKDKAGNFKSAGLEISAYMLSDDIEAVIIRFASWYNISTPILDSEIKTNDLLNQDLPF